MNRDKNILTTKSQSSFKGKERFDPIKKDKKKFSSGYMKYDNNNKDENVSGHSIYIFNLPPEASNNDLWRLFAPFGSIKNVAVMKDEDSINKGYAFVTMKNFNEATMAIEILNGQSLLGRPLKINFKSKTQKTANSLGDVGAYPLYVYNLSQDCEENSLWKLFTQFGAVKNISIVKDTNHLSKRYAFVTMKTVEDATNAIKTLNGFTLDGRQLSVSFKNRKNDEKKTDDSIENKIGEFYIYINNLTPDTEESVLWKLFAQFGAIKDVNLVKDSDSKKCLGYGFVTMKSFDEANLAINALNNSKLDERTIHVSFKTKKVKE